jgi:hypothetical protein
MAQCIEWHISFYTDRDIPDETLKILNSHIEGCASRVGRLLQTEPVVTMEQTDDDN